MYPLYVPFICTLYMYPFKGQLTNEYLMIHDVLSSPRLGNNVNHGPHRFFVGKDANARSQIVPRYVT